MKLYIGTSGYSYPQWKGAFYPQELPAQQMLHYFAEQLPTVEINNTFHRMPKAALLEGWAEQVPADFKFALKAPQRITHFQRLKGIDEALSYFLGVAGVLKKRLGPLLFQLPPDLEKDLPLLRGFLQSLPARPYRAAIEFRNPSWFDDEVFALLRQHNAALCVSDGVGDLMVPCLPTADWGYLRLRRLDYDTARLTLWGERIKAQGWQEAFVYFKHEDAARGPLLARQLIELTGAAESR
jgi:uncharacterized protein YecE (DUF72 family)